MRGNLQQLVDELERQRASRVDFVAGTAGMRLARREQGQLPYITHTAAGPPPGGAVQFNEHAWGQFLGKLPQPVSRDVDSKMRQFPSWLTTIQQDLDSKSERRFVRCMDGRVRAFMSDSYAPIDHYDLAFAALDVAREAGVGATVLEGRLSEREMRLSFTTQDIAREVRIAGGGGGDTWRENHRWVEATGIQWGTYNPPRGTTHLHPIVTIRNSETGDGSFQIMLGVLDRLCLNGSIIEKAISKVHLGAGLTEGMYSAETITAISRATVLQARDIIKAAFTPDWFYRMVDRVQKAADERIEQPVRVFTNLAQDAQLGEQERDELLKYFTLRGDSTRYGVAAAASRRAQDVTDAELASFLEDLAGSVLVGRRPLDESEREPVKIRRAAKVAR